MLIEIFTVLRMAYQYCKEKLVFGIAMGLTSSLFFLFLISHINEAIATDRELSYEYASAFLLYLSVGVVCLLISQKSLNDYGTELTSSLRLDLCKHLVSMHLEDFDRVNNGRLMASLTEDTSAISASIWSIAALVTNIALIVCGCFYLAYLSTNLFLVTTAILFSAFFVNHFISTKTLKLIQSGQKIEYSLYKYYEGIINGAEALKLNKGKANFYLREKIESRVRRKQELQRSTNLYWNAGLAWNNFILFSTIGVCILLNSHFGSYDKTTIASFVITILFLKGSLNIVVDLMPVYLKGNTAIQNLKKIKFDLFSSADDTPGYDVDTSFVNSIELIDVSYKYNQEERICFSPLSYHFEEGNIYFLKGKNGTGKSTLLRILSGLYCTQDGIIKVNGQVVDSIPAGCSSLLKGDDFVFDFILDSNSNLCNELSIRKQLNRFQIELVSTDNKGFVSTEGLSVGQKQRLSLISLLFEDRKVLLFDEWSANQDQYFTSLFYESILPELKSMGKIIIVATHDNTWDYCSDSIIDLDIDNAYVPHIEMVNRDTLASA